MTIQRIFTSSRLGPIGKMPATPQPLKALPHSPSVDLFREIFVNENYCLRRLLGERGGIFLQIGAGSPRSLALMEGIHNINQRENGTLIQKYTVLDPQMNNIKNALGKAMELGLLIDGVVGTIQNAKLKLAVAPTVIISESLTHTMRPRIAELMLDFFNPKNANLYLFYFYTLTQKTDDSFPHIPLVQQLTNQQFIAHNIFSTASPDDRHLVAWPLKGIKL